MINFEEYLFEICLLIDLICCFQGHWKDDIDTNIFIWKKKYRTEK